MTKKDTTLEIKQIFDTNELDDLKRFMEKRRCLNSCNMYLIYIFHIVQSAGIMTTTIAVGYDKIYLIWLGVGLNIIASLINIYEKTNNNILKKLMIDIQAIKTGNYIDEGALIETEKDNVSDPIDLRDIYDNKNNDNKNNNKNNNNNDNKNNKYNIDNINPLATPLIRNTKEVKL